MPYQQAAKECRHCKQRTLHQRRTANHLVHAIVTLFLFGLWLPIWIIAAFSKGRWTCQRCGTAR